MDLILDGLRVVISYLLVLNIVVLVHCFGRFALARICKVKVHSVLLGRVGSWRTFCDKLNTRWIIGWAPVGGGVRFHGDADIPPPAYGQRETPFAYAPLWKQNVILLAGPLFNLTFASALFAALHMFAGQVVQVARVDEIVSNGSAQEAGLRPGDIIVGIDGAPIRTYRDMQKFIASKAEVPVELTIDCGGSALTLNAIPKAIKIVLRDGQSMTIGALGIRRSADPQQSDIHYRSFVDGIASGFEGVVLIVTASIAYQWNEIIGEGQQAARTVESLIGTFAGGVVVKFVNITAVLSASIGMVTTATSVCWGLWFAMARLWRSHSA